MPRLTTCGVCGLAWTARPRETCPRCEAKALRARLRRAAARLGAKGGAAGAGEAKRRPRELYQAAIRKRWDAVAAAHRAADAAAGREWVCDCGACRGARARAGR